jgi:hypothetical protein
METLKNVLGLSEEQLSALMAAREKGESLEAAQLLLASVSNLLRGGAGADALKKLSELERVLQNARQAGEMEPVVLPVYPSVEEAVRSGSWEDNAVFANLATQTAFLNELQTVVNQWTAAVRKANKNPRLESVKDFSCLLVFPYEKNDFV